jgi:hypothetical protein
MGALSATAIGRLTGLSLPTVAELLSSGWVFVEDGSGSGWLAPAAGGEAERA